MAAIRIPRRWCGPDGMGQGGVTAGLLAAGLGDGPVEVRLDAPAPLDAELDVRDGDDGARMLADASGRTIATARRIPAVEGTAPDGVDLPTARRVTGALRDRNPFGRCVICGHERDDSLRVWPGPVPGDREHVAAAFDVPAHMTDGATLAVPFVFGALDCTSGYAVLRRATPVDGLILTGTMQVELELPVPADAPVITTARVAEHRGRRWMVDVALHTPEGARRAHARVIWIEVGARTPRAQAEA